MVECEEHVNDKKTWHTYLNLYERADGATVIPYEFDMLDISMLGKMLG